MEAISKATDARYVAFGLSDVPTGWAARAEARLTPIAATPVEMVTTAPHPARDSAGELIRGKGAGKDFLYMHRQMVLHVNEMLNDLGQPAISAWVSPPRFDDKAFPPAMDYRLPDSMYRSKDDKVWTEMIASSAEALRPENLRRVTIDELGTDIEYGIHAGMHERFGAYSTSGKLRPG